jgi:hypothetical protein
MRLDRIDIQRREKRMSMQETLKLQLPATRKDVAAWLVDRELEELSIITSKMPEEHLYLKRRGALEEDEAAGIARFTIDAEEVSFGEVDGQKVPTYRTLKGIAVIELHEASPDLLEIRGLARTMGKVTPLLEEYIGRLARQLQEAFRPPDPE